MLALLPSSPSREIRSTGNVSAWERSGLTAAEASSIASFAATLEGYDACRDENMETRLQQRLRNEFTAEERETWHALAGPGKLWRLGVPCAQTERWWVPAPARWDAHPMCGYCCHKGIGLARCPASAIETRRRGCASSAS